MIRSGKQKVFFTFEEEVNDGAKLGSFLSKLEILANFVSFLCLKSGSMLFKVFLIAVCFYFFFQFNNSRNLEPGAQNRPLDEEDTDGEFIDYEEVD